ncbi:uncharacterized protein LOC124424304 isoform X2 [Vespa crabro]|uniref:uncharacterized protein LOC124424304 isoform X2 n=1 Tax=Vespa crabro TaxID=7445 RepID=UPI001F023662|nr:uncharacterized protein LOC124424304 isoform X2 [Vespa crabro]
MVQIKYNVDVIKKYHTSTVTAEIVVGAGNGNALGTTMTTTTTTTTRTATTTTSTSSTTTTTTTTLRPLDVELPPTLPMTFGTENSTTISAQSGSMALLPCVVHNLGDGVVSWIKRKTVQELLTVGLITYANDERFQAIHFHHSEDWTLQIKYVQGRDAGLYQCQVSTHPPTSIFLFLEVVEARAEISGPPEKYVRPGSTLQLHCVVRKSTETPSYLFWYHNYRMINYDIERGVNVSTDLIARESWLEVPRASDRHSGNYTCETSNALPARVLVLVIKGDNPAAMQHSSTKVSTLPHNESIFFSTLIVLIILS